jgi:pilus assembly protein TadC
MAKTVAGMTAEELRELVESAVEEKIVELFGDPDAGLALRERVRRQLARQRRAVAKGERGESLETVVRRLNL